MVDSAVLTSSELAQPPGSKPAKLRSACNCCFAAKVRCDGNKSGCKRCADKCFTCVYSISRVGKVVGKRRKKPLPTVKAEEITLAPNHTLYVAHASIPSPTPTQTSDEISRRSCSTNGWESFVSFDEAAPPFTTDWEEQILDVGAPDDATFDMSQNIQFAMQHGILTPSLSPPCSKFLSPNDLGTRALNQSAHPARMKPTQTPEFRQSQTVELSLPMQQEDDETVCIKLLAHLKRYTVSTRMSMESTLALIWKTNAALKRILHSKHARSDPSCWLLLSSILAQLVKLCELVSAHHNGQLGKLKEFDLSHAGTLLECQQGICIPRTEQSHQHSESLEAFKSAIQESLVSNTTISNLLKRKPSGGFQALGRQESLHAELDMRLKRALLPLS